MAHCCQALSIQERTRAAERGLLCSAIACARQLLDLDAQLDEMTEQEGWLAWGS